MPEPIWLDLSAVRQAHDEVIALTGGASGLRDEGLLLSALERPQNRFGYERVDDIPILAATYAVGIAKNHPFVDGNKRAAFVATLIFLRRNGLRFVASQADATTTMLGVAAGEIGIDDLADWLRRNTVG